MIMSGHQERQSDGWERCDAPISWRHLGALAAVAALATGFVGASSASGAELQAGRVGNTAPIGAANPCDNPTVPRDLWVEVMKSRTAHPDEIVELGLLAFSCDQKPLDNAQILITPEFGSPGIFIFPKGVEPVATGGEVWPSEKHPSDYGDIIEWFLWSAISGKPEGLKLKLIIPANVLGRYCLDAMILGPSTIRKLSICWNVPKAEEKPSKTKMVKPSSPSPKSFTHAPKDYRYKSGDKKMLTHNFR